jgi:hypothetical protein
MPLIRVPSIDLDHKLAELDVPIETLFYPKEHTPPLEHEYQMSDRREPTRHFSFYLTSFAHRLALRRLTYMTAIGYIKTIEHHHLVPCRHKIAH